MKCCRICGSMAINEHKHGRILNKDLDLCDVCYWRKQVKELFQYLEEINDIMMESWMIKGYDFNRNDGEKIMEVINNWATNH
jgi:hypothetical protein